MRKHLFNLMMATLFLVLTSCQSNPGKPANLFGNPFGNPSNPPQVSLGQSVQEALMRQEDPVIAQVHVESRQNSVVLLGYVKKIRQSDTAELIARQVPGVQSVENRIIVRP